MDESDFYLAVSCGVRERRLRSTLKLCELDDPWIDGEFCIRQCVPAVSFILIDIVFFASFEGDEEGSEDRCFFFYQRECGEYREYD